MTADRTVSDNQKLTVTVTDNNRRAALVERVARGIAKAEIEYFGPRSTLIQCQSWALHPDCYRQAAEAAIDLIRAEVLEEALKALYSVPRWDREIFDSLTQTTDGLLIYIDDAAAAIRALKEDSNANKA